MDTLLFAHSHVSVPVWETQQRFAANRIYCVGQNYAEHAREMGSDPNKKPPFFFTKATQTIVHSGTSLRYPPMTENLHHEIELVVALGQDAQSVSVEQAGKLIWGYGLGLDMTRRDLQAQAKEARQPWDMSKSFTDSAVITPLVKADQVAAIDAADIVLTVDGEVRQKGNTADMIWNVAELISYLSRYQDLRAGDLIYTGTPSGVGPVVRGNVLCGTLKGLPNLIITVA